MKRIAIVVLVVMALGILSVPATAEDMEPSVVIGMVADYKDGASITVNDEYTGSKNTFTIAGDALIEGDITVGSYVEVEAQGNVAVYISVITREDEE